MILIHSEHIGSFKALDSKRRQLDRRHKNVQNRIARRVKFLYTLGLNIVPVSNSYLLKEFCMQKQPSGGAEWSEIICDALKANDVRLVTYVPDNVLKPLINALHADPFFTTFCCTREEEAVGIVSGAWLGGMLGVVLMQTSGYATLPNVLASLCVPYQLPTLMIISERGTLGEFNIGQTMVCRTMRPSLNSMNIEHHTLEHLEDVAFIASRSIQQAVLTQAPVALILNPLLTGSKVEKKERS